MYSPVVDCASEIGRNAAAVVSDEISSGMRNSRAQATAASTGRRPAAIRTMIDSAMTMALSTSIPSAMMSAASDIWSSPTPRNDITSSEGDHRHRHEARHHEPGPRSEEEQHHHEDDADRLPEVHHELPDLARDVLRLEGDDVEVDPDRVDGLQPFDLLPDTVPERDHVAAVAHGDPEGEAGRAGRVDPAGRRVGVAARDRGQVPRGRRSPTGPATSPPCAAGRRPTRSCRSAPARCARPPVRMLPPGMMMFALSRMERSCIGERPSSASRALS